jgi:hypothetical protein
MAGGSGFVIRNSLLVTILRILDSPYGAIAILFKN